MIASTEPARRIEKLLDPIEGLLASLAGDDRRRLFSATIELDGPVDPCAMAFASRLAGDRWFCWEEPDRDFALAAIGSAHEVVSRGPRRFSEVERDCAAAVRDRLAEEPDDLPGGAGPVWVGGFAFDPEGGREPQWSSLPPALLVMPEVAIVRTAGRAFLTACVVATPGRDGQTALTRLRARLGGLRAEPISLRDPHATDLARIASARPPSEFERAVARCTERIRAGELEKVVLAREVTVEAPVAHDPASTFAALRELFPSCFCFCVGTPEAAFLGASPELLVRRAGAVAATVALAGTARRSADPTVDAHLAEQLLRSDKDRREHEIVVRRIERALARHAVWVQRPPEPEVIEVANVQHLATPIHAQLAEARSVVALAGDLHPTPAVGGEPREAAIATIGELEQMDRGWYAGPVGWMDASEDGELCVALRSALLRDRTAHAYAGGGVVAGSDPAAELAETEVKLGALLPLLAG